MCRRSCFSVYLIGLNPYYTGIHLHTEKLAPRNFGNKKVLILIILEYIYIKDVIICTGILVTVLILIILEYIYIIGVTGFWKKREVS